MWAGAKNQGGEPNEWLNLSSPVLRADAAEKLALKTSFPAAALRALIDKKAYRDPVDGRLVIWPWYRHQDDEIRARADAAESGLEVGPFLDEPFESAYYLRFTGAEEFIQLAREADIDHEALLVERIPLYIDGFDAVRFEGGLEAENPIQQRAKQIRDVSRLLERESAHRDAVEGALSKLVCSYIAWLDEVDDPVEWRPLLQLDGEPEKMLSSEFAIRSIWAVDQGVALEWGDRLVLLDEGEVISNIELVGDCEIVFAARTTALVRFSDWHALDLTGEWLDGELDLVGTFSGPLSHPPWIRGGANERSAPDEGVRFSPDARYEQVEDSEIIRMMDGFEVSSYEPFDRYGYRIEDEVPVLAGLDELEPAGVATVFDGVIFTHRAPRGFSIKARVDGAFALHKEGWRAVEGELLKIATRPIARIPSVQLAAFDRSAERLWVVTDSHLLDIEWREKPELRGARSLELIAAEVSR